MLQCTGLKDKKPLGKPGQLIFQDDIGEDENGIRYLINFRYGRWVAMHGPKCHSESEGECKWDDLYEMLKIHGWDIEIIGNIHENPDLLKAVE